MGMPVSVRLDAKTQGLLEEAARARGIGLSTYLREIAAAEAKRVRAERIRAETKRVAEYIRSSPEAQAFNDDWAGPPSPPGTFDP